MKAFYLFVHLGQATKLIQKYGFHGDPINDVESVHQDKDVM